MNGYGARCGCGGRSVLHLRRGREVTPVTSEFYCTSCVVLALAAFRALPGQPPYWPGDEDRDEPYEPPEAL